MAVVANGLAGAYALAAWRFAGLRGRPVWVAAAGAQVALAVQVVIGVLVERDESVAAPDLHAFYGYVVLITIGLAYSYRASMRGRLEWFYGLVGLFLMGLGIRAMLL